MFVPIEILQRRSSARCAMLERAPLQGMMLFNLLRVIVLCRLIFSPFLLHNALYQPLLILNVLIKN